MTKKAMKLAVEAITQYLAESPTPSEEAVEGLCDARAILRKALAEQPAQQDSTCSNALRAQGKAYPRTCKKCGLGPCVELAQQALDKMAENALEQPAQKCSYPYCGCNSKAWCKVERNEALNKMAENARELGLDYEPDIPFGDNNPGLPWDEVPQAFNDWWNADYDPTGNPFEKDTHAYWAWAGWKAAEQPAQRKPLTDEQLPAMWTDAVRKAALPPNKSALIHYKEAIEAAHGIKENT